MSKVTNRQRGLDSDACASLTTGRNMQDTTQAARNMICTPESSIRYSTPLRAHFD